MYFKKNCVSNGHHLALGIKCHNLFYITLLTLEFCIIRDFDCLHYFENRWDSYLPLALSSEMSLVIKLLNSYYALYVMKDASLCSD